MSQSTARVNYFTSHQKERDFAKPWLTRLAPPTGRKSTRQLLHQMKPPRHESVNVSPSQAAKLLILLDLHAPPERLTTGMDIDKQYTRVLTREPEIRQNAEELLSRYENRLKSTDERTLQLLANAGVRLEPQHNHGNTTKTVDRGTDSLLNRGDYEEPSFNG